jgi:hypothetical protein
MDDLLVRIWSDLSGRLTGPLTFRLILQPSMAALHALRDGVRDARDDRPAYFWTIATHPADGARLLVEGWHAVLRVVLLGTVMDVVYQLMVFGRIYPLEVVLVVLSLAFVPYLLLRGPFNRIARRWVAPRKERGAHA